MRYKCNDFFFLNQRPGRCVLESQTTRNLDTCAFRPDLWEWGAAEHIPQAPGAAEREGFRERDPQRPLATPELGRPTRVGLLRVPVCSKEIRCGGGVMSRAVGTMLTQQSLVPSFRTWLPCDFLGRCGQTSIHPRKGTDGKLKKWSQLSPPW